jgi:DNA repair exonuclease SbcCD ATPase subunit
MNRELPAFAKALKRRHQALNTTLHTETPSFPSQSRQSLPPPSHRIPSFETSDPKRDSSDLTEDTEDCDHQQLSAIHFRTDASELQRRLRFLQQENRNLLQTNREMMSELSDLKADNFDFPQMSRKLTVTQREIHELTELIQSADTELTSLHQARIKLESDYKRLLDLRSIDSESIASNQFEINRITREIESLRSNGRIVDDIRSSFRNVVENQPKWQPQVVPSAMKDNLHFGDENSDGKGIVNIPVNQMNDGELRTRLQALTKEKEEKERMLNRAPPKGVNSAHVRRQKEQLDEEVVALDKILSKIRLEMKRRQIY